ncbi:MAG: S-layer homology domain-containing protein [Clostridia bacterium]|nr:S-layer homology domain-containing protein [Clostridia bacterium]
MNLVKRAGLMLLIFALFCTSAFAQTTDYAAKDKVYSELKSITFDDMAYMPVNHWSSVAVYTVAAAGLIKGYESDFNPTGTVTRSEALAVLFRSSGDEETANSYYSKVLNSKIKAPNDYNNIDSWADGYVRLAVDYGILTPDEYIYCMSKNYNSDGAFPKNMPALKSELAEWIVRVYKLPLQQGESKIAKFYDYDKLKDEDKPYLETAVYYGILNGSGDKLDPYVTITREQMAQIFYNIRTLWAQKIGYEIIQTSVLDVVKETVQGDGKLTNDIKIVTDFGSLITKREYKLNGETVDNAYNSQLIYNDFVVIAEGNLPTDSTILKKSDGISIFTKDGDVKFILKNKNAGTRDFSSEEYKDATVYKGKLYFLDADEMTVVLKTEQGFKEIECTLDTQFSYRTKTAPISTVNEKYKDHNAYVFTCIAKGDQREFAYRVQITD